jgi:threonyl-tRNA synthetase
MQLAATLWAAGIAAEFGFKQNPKMGDQLGYALDHGIPFMVLFGEDELNAGMVKVKDMAAKEEATVHVAGLVEYLKTALAESTARAAAAAAAAPGNAPGSSGTASATASAGEAGESRA